MPSAKEAKDDEDDHDDAEPQHALLPPRGRSDAALGAEGGNRPIDAEGKPERRDDPLEDRHETIGPSDEDCSGRSYIAAGRSGSPLACAPPAGWESRDRPMLRSIRLARLALWSSSQRPNAGGDSAGA